MQYYNLIFDGVRTITSVTLRRTKIFQTPIGRFSYEHIIKTRFAFGYFFEKSIEALIATPEKALLDYFSLRVKDVAWHSQDHIENYLLNDMRIDLETFCALTSQENLSQCLPFYHRNSNEHRLLKRLMARKG